MHKLKSLESVEREGGVRSKVARILVQSTVGSNVSILWVFVEGRMQLLEGGSVSRLQGPAGQHELVDCIGTLA